jgi:hypothetical protein
MKPPPLDPRDLLMQWIRMNAFAADDSSSFTELLSQLALQIHPSENYPNTRKGEAWQGEDYPLFDWQSQSEGWKSK